MPLPARPTTCGALAVGVALAALSGSAPAREDPPRPAGDAATPRDALAVQGGPPEVVALDQDAARTADALGRGLDWLAAQQARIEDGSFPAAGARQYVPVPVAALGALAFMAGGSSPDRGPHGRAVAHAVDYLLAHADLVPGSPEHGYISSEGDGTSRMHGHLFATLALTQAWTMSPRTPRGRRIEEVLRAAIALVERSQGLEGAWFYYPRSSGEHENSVTVVGVQALRAARGAGIHVNAEGIARAVDYIRRCQTEDGSFRYALSSGETSVALTAAGLTTLNSAGIYAGGEVDRAIEALWRRLGYRADEPDADVAKFPYYERLYLAQALWQHSDPRLFERWVEDERARVLHAQRKDGSWSSEAFGDCYSTAVNCLFLALPDGLLPIFQR